MQITQSYRYAKNYTSSASTTFYLASLMFERDIQKHIWAIYSFCRYADDIADKATNHSIAKEELEQLRAMLNKKLPVGDKFWPALFDTIELHNLPLRPFNELLDGIASDLVDARRIADENELINYSYLVAGTVGMICARLLSISSQVALKSAKQLGIAMQITNICRDVGEDARINRIYIPQDLLKKNNLQSKDILQFRYNDDFKNVMAHMVALAQANYEQAQKGIEQIPPRSRKAVVVASNLYQSILNRIVESNYKVYNKRIRVPNINKLLIAVKS